MSSAIREGLAKRIVKLFHAKRVVKSPMVSVVMPSYNHAPFIERAVHSVLAQSVKNLELIIVDDGSTDGTPEIIRKINDPRIKFLGLKNNRASHARNIGLSIARGRYIAFQNSDDVWAENKLAMQMQAMEYNTSRMACFTGVKLIDEADIPINSGWASGGFTIENRPSYEWLRQFFERGNCLCISSAFVRRRAVEKAGRFRNHLVQLSDLDLWVRLAAIGEFHIIPDELTRMRILCPAHQDHDTNKILRRNFSAPNPESDNRTILEFAEVLSLYSESPLIGKISTIFGDKVVSHSAKPHIIQFLLAKRAWKLGTPAHYLFADRVMAQILESEHRRDDLLGFFGPGVVLDFIEQRGRITLSVTVQ